MEHVCVGGTYAYIINIQSLHPCLRIAIPRSHPGFAFSIEIPLNQPCMVCYPHTVFGICFVSVGAAGWRDNAATNGAHKCLMWTIVVNELATYCGNVP